MESLKIENQLCFPLYVCSKEVVRKYKPLLDKIGLTYTQYIAMLILWDKKTLTLSELGDYLYLDSGTLTPLLKKLESKGYINRKRDEKDERNLIISITVQGETLKKKAKNVPYEIKSCLDITEEEAKVLYKTLYKIILNMDKER